MAAYVVAAWLGGRNAGLVAALAAIWLTVVIRKVVTRSVPSVLTISVVVLTVQTAVVLATGELWLFLLQFPLANLCPVRAVRPDGEQPGPARCPAGRRGGRAAPAVHPSPGPAPLLPRGYLAVGGYLPAAHGRAWRC